MHKSVIKAGPSKVPTKKRFPAFPDNLYSVFMRSGFIFNILVFCLNGEFLKLRYCKIDKIKK